MKGIAFFVVGLIVFALFSCAVALADDVEYRPTPDGKNYDVWKKSGQKRKAEIREEKADLGREIAILKEMNPGSVNVKLWREIIKRMDSPRRAGSRPVTVRRVINQMITEKERRVGVLPDAAIINPR